MIKVLILVLVFQAIAIGDSAVQTDWSGGPGTWGPVSLWEEEFQTENGISWLIPDEMTLMKQFLEHILYASFGATRIETADIDGDGDRDILAVANANSWVQWWENVDGTGTSWIKHSIEEQWGNAQSVIGADLDSDGDQDVLATASWEDDVTWWENVSGTGLVWQQHLISGFFDGASSALAADLDGDGDMDVIGAADQADDIIWWENDDGQGTSWPEHLVAGDFTGANDVYVLDMDADGDMDILGAAHYDGICFWENVDGTGMSWTAHPVTETFGVATSVTGGDLDGDGDMDVIGVSNSEDRFTWWENVDGPGTVWMEHDISVGLEAPQQVSCADLDEDGDLDLLGVAYYDGIYFWENMNGTGSIWKQHSVHLGEGHWSACFGNLDDDGFLDVLGISNGGKIHWWEYIGYSSGWMESSVLDTGTDPSWSSLDWSGEIPSGTSVKFQVRSSDNYTAMGDWSDTLATGGSLSGILEDGDRYVQYRALLSTDNPDITPTLDGMSISWNPVGIAEDPGSEDAWSINIEPNPCIGTGTLRFSLHGDIETRIRVLDLAGRTAWESLYTGTQEGEGDMPIPDLPSGVYTVILETDDQAFARRFTVVR